MKGQLERITELARSLVRAERELEKAEERVKECKEEVRRLSEVDLPEAMSAADMQEFTLKGGYRIMVSTEYYASITKEKAEEAFDWLREHEHGDLIKRDVTLTFTAGEDGKAERCFNWLSRVYKNDAVKSREVVHPATLKAWVKGQFEAGEDFPRDLFGVFVRDVAKIEAPE